MPAPDPLPPSASPGHSDRGESPGPRSEPVATAPRQGRQLWRRLVSGVAFWLGGTALAAGAFLGALSFVAPRPEMKMAVTLDQNATAGPEADRAKATATPCGQSGATAGAGCSRAAGATTANPPRSDAGKRLPSGLPSGQATPAAQPSAEATTVSVPRGDAANRSPSVQATAAGQPSADKQTANIDKRPADKQPGAETPPPSAEKPAASAEAPARPQRERSVERRQRHKDGDRRIVERDRDMRSGRSVVSRRDRADEPLDPGEAGVSAYDGPERRRIIVMQPDEPRRDLGFFGRLFAPHDAD
jgi:hypothetical protein